DIDEASLGSMLAYARRCAAAVGAGPIFSATTDRRAALAGANFVLVSIATKRMELWEQDFRVPLAFGIPHVYGENGGPGAAFHALRNFEVVIPICRDIEEICPDAWMINFTNPEARVLTAVLTLTKVKAIGLCHGFYSFRRMAEAVLGRPLGELDIRTAGMNHFYTYYKVAERSSGRDLIPELESALAADPSVLPPLARYLWERFGALGYVSDHHIGEYLGFAHEILGNLWVFGDETRPIGDDERGVDSRVVFEAWRRGLSVAEYLARDIPAADRKAGEAPVDPAAMRYSGELAAPVIADIALDRGKWREAMNLLNTGRWIENVDADACVELPAVVGAGGPVPDRVGRLPEGFAAMIRQQQSIQKLLV
ncbi:MAG: hypothetical protein Q8M76_11695, partial [Spirochaetaceae bacterium]|nr:hypothetical protein [Spirochaetaceae bacterium]